MEIVTMDDYDISLVRIATKYRQGSCHGEFSGTRGP